MSEKKYRQGFFVIDTDPEIEYCGSQTCCGGTTVKDTIIGTFEAGTNNLAPFNTEEYALKTAEEMAKAEPGKEFIVVKIHSYIGYGPYIKKV